MQTKDDGRRQGRILVIDDQEHMCWVLAKLLSERGHEVKTAHSGASALRAIGAGFECQVAIVDYRLPDKDGIALILEMTSRLPGLRAILMTSYGSAALLERAAFEKLFAYFDKPFKNDLMIHTVEDAIGACQPGEASLAPGACARTRFPGRATPEP